MKSFDELNDLGLELVQYIDNNEDGIQCINSQLQGCQERWDNLVQHMEQLSNGLASSGVQMSISKGPNGVQSIKVSKKGEDPISFSLPKPTLPSPLAPRRPPGDPSRHKIEFDRQVAALSEWLDQTEVTQELVTGESCDPHDQLSLEEQTVLLEVSGSICWDFTMDYSFHRLLYNWKLNHFKMICFDEMICFKIACSKIYIICKLFVSN